MNNNLHTKISSISDSDSGKSLSTRRANNLNSSNSGKACSSDYRTSQD